MKRSKIVAKLKASLVALPAALLIVTFATSASGQLAVTCDATGACSIPGATPVDSEGHPVPVDDGPSTWAEALGKGGPASTTTTTTTSSSTKSPRAASDKAAHEAIAAASSYKSGDNWGCEVMLCLANPQGPTAVSQCVPPIKKLWKHLAKGHAMPACTFANSDGKEVDSRSKGTYIDHAGSDPNVEGACPFVYYAGESRNKYCAFSGVTNEYIDGVLWGRIWHGGPTSQPYIEYLHADPDHPRPADGFEAAWALLKSSIEDKSDYAAKAKEIAIASEARAAAAERIAAKAQAEADAASASLASLEATLPAALESANAAWAAASVAWDAVAGPYLAAKAKAEAPGATAADRAAYDALRGTGEGTFLSLQNAANRAHYYAAEVASLPAKRAATQAVVDRAASAVSDAEGKRAVANADQAERVAAAKAAEPYPDWYGAGG
jgi:hypothetical protein